MFNSKVIIAAPKRYYANLTFAVMETEEGYVSYSSQMNDTGSELFKTVEENVARMVSILPHACVLGTNTCVIKPYCYLTRGMLGNRLKVNTRLMQ